MFSAMSCFCLTSRKAFLTWRCSAHCVGGMFSRFQLFSQNISRRASFTFSWILTQSYKARMNLSIILSCQDFSTNNEKILYITQGNDSVLRGKDLDASHTTNLVFLWSTEVYSAPVRAWKKGNDAKLSVPIFINVSLIL